MDQSASIEQIRVSVLPDGRMTRENAARYIGHAPKTLAMWALQAKGPRFVKVAGRVFYYRSDLNQFINGPIPQLEHQHPAA